MSMFTQAKEFLWKHRTKIVVASVIAIAATAYIAFSQDEEEESNNAKDSNNKLNAIANNGESTDSQKSGKASGSEYTISQSDRNRMTIKARRQFDSVIGQFLTTASAKISEAVDLATVVKKIKDLRASDQENTRELEEELWDEIKTSSFVLLIVNSLTLSILTTLLRVQVHILAKYAFLMSKRMDKPSDDLELDEETFRVLIEGTYKHLMERGLQTIIQVVRQRVVTIFGDWTIADKLSVEYGDLIHSISLVRRSVEADLHSLLKRAIVDDDALPLNAQSLTPSVPQQILNQTWDIIESPMFCAAVQESLETTYRHVFDQLRRNIFTQSEVSSLQLQSTSLRTPPLASLLPQLKNLGMSLLCQDSMDDSAAVIKEMVQGPILDSLCLLAFDATTAK